jgi:hypothetical protein
MTTNEPRIIFDTAPRRSDGLLRLTVDPLSDYLVLKCADCGDMTKQEYLGTTYEQGTLSIRITCPHCNRSDERKLLDPDWKGLPNTPELEARLLGDEAIVDLELARMLAQLARAEFDDEEPEAGPPPIN